MLLCRAGYLGWNFRGTNVQPGQRTVEGEFERILGGKVRFLSRTDAGVSAFNNYALCRTEKDPFSVNQLEDAWVVGYVEIDKRPRVYWRWYRYYMPGEVEVGRDVLDLFVGKKDFTSFSVPEGRDPVREVLRFSSFTIPGFTVFDVVGRSFLRQMVRRMVNAAVLAARGEIEVEELFENPRPKAVPPAPAEGLVLMDMKLDIYVPADPEVRRRVRERLEGMWRDVRIRGHVLRNAWVLR